MDPHSSVQDTFPDSPTVPKRVSWAVSDRSGRSSRSSKSRDSESSRYRKYWLSVYEQTAAHVSRTFFPATSSVASDELRIESLGAGNANPAQRSKFTVIDISPHPHLVGWESDHDSSNPLNWPMWKKATNITVILMMCVIHAFAATAFIPAMQNIMESFAARNDNACLSAFTVSAYILGHSLGPLLVVPFSEIFGRVPAYHCCNLLFVGFTCWCAVPKNVVQLILARFIGGIGGGVTQVLAAGSITDISRGNVCQLLLTMVGAAIYLTPAISPVAGGYINAKLGWPWIFWMTVIVGGFFTIAGFALLFESYEPVLLFRKAYRLRKTTHNQNLRSLYEASPSQRVPKGCWAAVRLPLRMMLSPSVFVTSTLPATGLAFLYIVYITLPQVLPPVYRWPSKNFGLAYLGIAVGVFIILVCGAAASTNYVKLRAKKYNMKAEDGIIPLICCWPLTGLGLFLYGWAVHTKAHWITALVSLGIVGAGSMSAIICNSLYVMYAFPGKATYAIHANILLQSLLAGIIPIVSYRLYDYFSAPYAFYFLGAIALFLTFFPGLLYLFRRQENRTS